MIPLRLVQVRILKQKTLIALERKVVHMVLFKEMITILETELHIHGAQSGSGISLTNIDKIYAVGERSLENAQISGNFDLHMYGNEAGEGAGNPHIHKSGYTSDYVSMC